MRSDRANIALGIVGVLVILLFLWWVERLAQRTPFSEGPP
jgi:hypothetical protein